MYDNEKSSNATIAPASGALRLRPVKWHVDLPVLLAIERAGFAIPWDWEKFLQFSFKANGAALVAESDGVIVGFMLYERFEDRSHVAHIAVRPQSQNMGIGRQMLMSLCEGLLVESAEILPVVLNVRRSNIHAQQLYLHLGFTQMQVRPAHYDNGEDAIVMRYKGFVPGFSLTDVPPTRMRRALVS